MSYYRLYFFEPHEHGIILFLEIQAAGDEIAISKAQEERGQYALELWCGTRKVLEIGATDYASRVRAARNGPNPRQQGFDRRAEAAR